MWLLRRATPRITTKRIDLHRRLFHHPDRLYAARLKPTTISFCPGVCFSCFALSGCLSVRHSFRDFFADCFSRLDFSLLECLFFFPLPHMVRYRFYYPTGRPISKEQLDASLLRLAATFQQLPNCQASREHFGTIAKVIARLFSFLFSNFGFLF